MNRKATKAISSVLAVGVLATGIGFGGVAEAGSKGRRNTAAALGAVSAYSLIQGKGTIGLATGAGAVYAYSRYRKARKSERNRHRRKVYYRRR